MNFPLQSEADVAVCELPILELDPARMAIRSDGLGSLHWPVTIAELQSVRDRFVEGLFVWCRDWDIDRSRDAELIWLNAAQISVEVLRLFNGVAVQRRTARRYRLAPPSGRAPGLVQALAAGRKPAFSPFSSKTLSGIRADPAWRKAIRFGKNAFSRQRLSYRPKGLIEPAGDIVTFSAGGLIAAHAKAIDRRVVLSKFDEWMTAGELPKGAGPALGQDSVTALLDLAKEAFEAGGERLPGILAPYFCDFLCQICRRTGFHLEELERQARRLPRQFWSGTGGILYNRVMSRAVTKTGGIATGHDHGTGSGCWETYYQTVFELNYVDRFVTYSEALAAGLRRNLRHDLLARGDQLVQIESVPSPRRPRVASSPKMRPDLSVPSAPLRKTVMYAPTVYAGETMYLLPLLADPVAVDWQCRLLAFLRGEGYEILVKPHPESYCQPPAAFADHFGARFVEEPFESAMLQADVLLFDYLQTSCIVDAVRSDAAIVLVEFPRLALQPEARGLLTRRAALVSGWFDDAARAHVDWAAMRSAFATASQLRDKSFADTYYPI